MATTLPSRVVGGAQAVIAEHGWRNATLARIAEAAGVSRMTLHRHGIGREEILALLTVDYERAFQAALWPAVTGAGSARERLEAALGAICDVTEAHLPFLRALDEETDSRIFHEHGGDVRSRDPYVASIERLLRDGGHDASLRVADPEETATLVVNVVDRTYRHLRGAHGWAPQRAREALIALVVDGLAS